MLPWLLRGAVLAGGRADFSAVHTALLYAGRAVVGVGERGWLGAPLGVCLQRCRKPRPLLGHCLPDQGMRLMLPICLLLWPTAVAG